MQAIRLPRWTEYQEASGGRDPLGLDRVAGRFLDDALPGITSTTRRARYYSAYCWIIRTARELVPRGDGRPFEAAFQRRETLLALASVAHHAGQDEEALGVAGFRRASKEWEESGAQCRIDFRVLKEPLGGLDAAYRAPMRHLGLLVEGADGLQLTDLGRTVADAFGSSVAKSTVVRDDLLGEPEVPRRAIENFARSGCLCRLDEPRERDPLRDAFLRRGTDQHDTLVWLLDVAARADAVGAWAEADRSLPDLALEWAAYGGVFPDGTGYLAAPPLRRISSRWRVFAALSFFAYFMEELAAAVADALRHAAAPMLVPDIATLVLGEVEDEPVSACVARLAGFGVEHDLYDEVRAGGPPGARARLALHGLLAGYALHRDAQGEEWSLFQRYAGTDLWPGTLRDLVEEMGADATVQGVGARAIEHLVLRHHQRVLYEKRRLESAVFVRDGDRWHAEQLVEPRFTSSRLRNCVQILIDLGLLERVGDGGARPTADGVAVLRGRGAA